MKNRLIVTVETDGSIMIDQPGEIDMRVGEPATFVKESWIDRLEKIEQAATALVRCKGRYHSEQAMKALTEAVNIPHF